MIDNMGIIRDALNPANEGLTPRQALTREMADVYSQINRINNVYIDSQESAYAHLVATADNDLVGACAASGHLLLELSERINNNTLSPTLLDCGMEMDGSNLDAMLTRIFGADAPAAKINIQNVQDIWAATHAQIDPAFMRDVLARFTAIADSIRAAQTTTTTVAGV